MTLKGGKHEYGGPETTWLEAFILALLIVAIAGLIKFALG
jgi:hypothetical protein